MYRIKQNSANYRTYSAFIKTRNCHLYHYAGNNPVRYIDPDGKSSSYEEFFDIMEEDFYNEIVTGTKIVASDFQGQALNFIDNIKNGNYSKQLKFSGEFNFGLLSGSISWDPLNAEMPITHKLLIGDADELYKFFINCTDMNVTFFLNENTLSCSVNIFSVSIEDNRDDTASVSVSVGIPDKIKKILENTVDASISLSITASTQDGTHGTLNNGKNKDLRKNSSIYSKRKQEIQERMQEWYFNEMW